MSTTTNSNYKPLGWDVEPSRLKDSFGLIPTSKCKLKSLRRSDNEDFIGLVPMKYQPFYNEDFAKLLYRVTEATEGKYFVDKIQSREHGRRIVGYIQRHQNGVIGGQETIVTRALINTHGDTKPLYFGAAHRVLSCTNGWGQIKESFALNHDVSLYEQLENLQIEMIQSLLEAEEELTIFREYAGVSIDESLIQEGIRIVLGLNDDTRVEDDAEARQLVRRVDQETNRLGNSLWGFFNGVTRYTTHDIRNGNLDTIRFQGKAYNLNENAFEFCKDTYLTSNVATEGVSSILLS